MILVCLLSCTDEMRSLLSVVLVRDSELLAAMGTTGSQNATAVLGGHTLTEAMLVHTAAIVRLKCSLHLCFVFILLLFCLCFRCERVLLTLSGCKITHKIRNDKELCDFSVFFSDFLVTLHPLTTHNKQ